MILNSGTELIALVSGLLNLGRAARCLSLLPKAQPPAPRGSLPKQAGSFEPRSIPEIPERYIDMQTPVSQPDAEKGPSRARVLSQDDLLPRKER